MPIPLVFIGIGAGAAALGVGKTFKAGIDQKEAKETNERANDIVERSNRITNECRKNSGNAITILGEKKLWILDNSIKPFIESFEKIHNIDFQDSVGLLELNDLRIDKQAFDELKEMQGVASSIIGGMASGAAMGAVTAFGAYGAVSTFAAASTGTAIASLSGAAATNATLAFLGGGALSVGGLGVAGGTAVLGGLVAGPALAVLGFVVGAKASANKDEAFSNLSKAKEHEEQMRTVQSMCKGIRMRASMFTRLLIKLNIIFAPLVYEMDGIINKSGTDYSTYTDEQKKKVAEAMSVAGMIKAVLDTPILTEEGDLTKASESVSNEIQLLLGD